MTEHELRMGKEQTGTRIVRHTGAPNRRVAVFGTWGHCSCNGWNARIPGTSRESRLLVEQRWQKHVEEA